MIARNLFSPRVQPGTICLTFDDGPGPNTLPIAELLARHAMRATFFVVGKHVEQFPDVRARLLELGHWVGNHTFSHRELAGATAEEAVGEVLRTDELIAGLLGDGPFLFRPPRFSWRPRVADWLNGCAELRKYSGPILCDIDCHDYRVGRTHDGQPWTLEKCRAECLLKIRGAGVVLLHDSSANPGPEGAECRANNRTLELLEWLVPQIASRYQFLGLHEVQSDMPVVRAHSAAHPKSWLSWLRKS